MKQYLFQEYSGEYQQELYHRIAEENRNIINLDKKLSAEIKRKKKESATAKRLTEAQNKKETEREAARQLEIKVRHQQEETERRSLARAMMADSESNRPTLNASCLKVLNNYQGNQKYMLFKRKKKCFFFKQGP